MNNIVSKETILILILLCIIITFYFKYGAIDSIYVKSKIDEKYYSVRDVNDKYVVADILATIKLNVLKLIEYMKSIVNDENSKYKEYKQYVTRLDNRMNHVVISENISDTYYTSYSVKKGKELVFCVRSRRNKKDIHDMNLMMYVVLHEISHIACPEYGHTNLFKKIFAFITQCAINIGIYQRIDFKNDNREYCGLTITDSII